MECSLKVLKNIKGLTSNTKLNYWLSHIDDDKRRIFIDTLFTVINSTKCDNFPDLIDNWQVNIPIMLNAIKNIDEEIKDLIIDILKELGLVHFKKITPRQKFNIHKFKDSFYTLFHPKKHH